MRIDIFITGFLFSSMNELVFMLTGCIIFQCY